MNSYIEQYWSGNEWICDSYLSDIYKDTHIRRVIMCDYKNRLKIAWDGPIKELLPLTPTNKTNHLKIKWWRKLLRLFLGDKISLYSDAQCLDWTPE